MAGRTPSSQARQGTSELEPRSIAQRRVVAVTRGPRASPTPIHAPKFVSPIPSESTGHRWASLLSLIVHETCAHYGDHYAATSVPSAMLAYSCQHCTIPLKDPAQLVAASASPLTHAAACANMAVLGVRLPGLLHTLATPAPSLCHTFCSSLLFRVSTCT